MIKKMQWFSLIFLLLVSMLPWCGCGQGKKEKIALQVAMLKPPSNLNPLLARESATQEVTDVLYRGLVDWNEKWEPFPVIASQVPTDENGGVIRGKRKVISLDFLIDPVARWSNGVYIEASDFSFFYELAKYPGLGGANDECLKQVERMATQGEERLEVSYFGLDPQSMMYLKPLPKLFLEALVYKNPRQFFMEPFKYENIVSGPYKANNVVIKKEKITSLTLDKNVEYNRKKQGLSSILLKFFNTPEAFESDLFAGIYDVIPYLTFEQGQKLSKSKDYTIYFTPGTTLNALFFDTQSKTLSDKRVRKALALGINRGEVVKSLYLENTSPARSWLSERHRDFVPVFDALNFNQKAAFELLGAAGWKKEGEKGWSRGGNTLSLTIFHGDDQWSQTAAKSIKDNWERMGVQVVEEKVSLAKFQESLMAKIKQGTYPDVVLASLEVPPWVQPSSLFASRYIPEERNNASGSNYGRWKSEQNEKLCKAVYEEPDRAKKKEFLKEQQECVADEVPLVPLCFRVMVSAAKKNVKNFTPRGFGSVLWNIEEWQKEPDNVGK
jgi:peptide/nickel transport system substrate-binding protein